MGPGSEHQQSRQVKGPNTLKIILRLQMQTDDRQFPFELPAPSLLATGCVDTHLVSRTWQVQQAFGQPGALSLVKPSTCLKCQHGLQDERPNPLNITQWLAPKYPPAPIRTYFREWVRLGKDPLVLTAEPNCEWGPMFYLNSGHSGWRCEQDYPDDSSQVAAVAFLSSLAADWLCCLLMIKHWEVCCVCCVC
ncbi:unnamed protein product [Rangifer tarandus platyrhynchus]|uniref:Uncharacterized protein n=1 Tax=Rangifer tarandus platyrhynchus TaxID=3082113 RepID=A0AC60A797_RANTA